MSFAADHNFWQQRVGKEVGARNKFIEKHFLDRSPKYGTPTKDYNLY
jgi:hypothetical protein